MLAISSFKYFRGNYYIEFLGKFVWLSVREFICSISVLKTSPIIMLFNRLMSVQSNMYKTTVASGR